MTAHQVHLTIAKCLHNFIIAMLISLNDTLYCVLESKRFSIYHIMIGGYLTYLHIKIITVPGFLKLYAHLFISRGSIKVCVLSGV